MFLDDFLRKRPGLRKALVRLIPNREVRVSILHRDLLISTQQEINVLRLSWLLNLAPTGHELAALFSLAGFVGPECTFVDIGANVGLFSVPMATLGEIVGFKVLAIEPNPDTAERLRRNLESYRCASVIEAAISNYEGRITMVSGPASAGFRVRRAEPAGARRRGQGSVRGAGGWSVPCLRLDQIAGLEGRPIVCKIDVEGHEAEVLEGMETLLSTGRVTAIMIDRFADQTIPARLRAHGLRLYDGRSLQDWNGTRHINVLAIRQREGGAGPA